MTSSEARSTAIEHVVHIDARPSIVYSMWTTATGLTRWFGPTLALDARPGGEIRIQVDDEHTMVGEFVELDPYRRILFTFGWLDGDVRPGTTTVEVTIEPDGSGSRLTLVHDGLPTDARAAHRSGWGHFLEVLRERAGGPGDERTTS